MNDNFLPTDLALERRAADTELPGIEYKETTEGTTLLSILTVNDEEGANSIGRGIGEYITLHTDSIALMSDGELRQASELLSKELKRALTALTDKEPNELSVLVVGLGNREATADALGVLTAEQVHATRHIRESDPSLFSMLSSACVSVHIPMTSGKSGIRTQDSVKSMVGITKPDAIIAVDALMALSRERLCRTIQIATDGIVPASAMGRTRDTLNRETLGVPVLGIGMPTAVALSTLVACSPNGDMAVSTVDCDLAVKRASRLISDALNSIFCTNL